jgi:hypothetical protein
MINRRGLITGLISFAAAPAIVRAASLMPVKVMKPDEMFIREFLEIIYSAPPEETPVIFVSRDVANIVDEILPGLIPVFNAAT